MPKAEDPLLENFQVFLAFARQRVGDPQLAEDLVQDSLVKALAAEHQPADRESSVTWFYRILRRSIIDLYRRTDARTRAMERFAQEFPETPQPSDERMLCQCFKRLLPSMPKQYRDVLNEVDLAGKHLGDVAEQMGVTRNSLTVRLHRARKHLKKALIQNCQSCGEAGCLDCTCGKAEAPHGR